MDVGGWLEGLLLSPQQASRGAWRSGCHDPANEAVMRVGRGEGGKRLHIHAGRRLSLVSWLPMFIEEQILRLDSTITY